MIWIIHFITINVLLLVSKIWKTPKLFVGGTFIYSIIVFGQRWMTGEDYPGYLLYYVVNFQGLEFLYQKYQDIFVYNGLSFSLMMFIIYIFIQFNIYLFLMKIEKHLILLIYVYSISEIYFIQMSQVRQWIAISLIILAFMYFFENKKIKGIVYFVLAPLFHTSAILTLPFFLIKLKNTKIVYVSILIACFILPLINIKSILFFLDNLLYSGYLGGTYDVKLGTYHYFKYYFVLFLGVVYIFNLKFKITESKSKLIISGFIYYCILYGLSFQFAPLLRVANYFKIFEFVFFIYFIEDIYKFSKKRLLSILVVVYLVFYFMVAIIDPYNITRYKFKAITLYEEMRIVDLQAEIRNFYNE